MSININNSRRTYNIRCLWYKPLINKASLDELDHKTKPSGIFYAREHQPDNLTENIDSDLVKIELQMVVIETRDNVEGICHDALVKYMGELWIVENIQSQIINKRSKFKIKPDKIYWISLRKGAQHG